MHPRAFEPARTRAPHAGCPLAATNPLDPIPTVHPARLVTDAASTRKPAGAHGDLPSAAEELERRGAWLESWLCRIPDAWLDEATSSELGPGLWDLGHMAAYEDRWLVRALGGETTRCPDPIRDPEREFSAFERPRPERRAMQLPSRSALEDYRHRVRAASLERLAHVGESPEARFAVSLIVQHEAQHLETLGQGWAALGRNDFDAFALGEAPIHELWRKADDPPFEGDSRARCPIPAGAVQMGRELGAQPFDCEAPAFEVQVEAFEIDRYPVSCERYARFVAAGGYSDERLWTRAGWSWCQAEAACAPLGWLPNADSPESWKLRRWGRTIPLPLNEPVVHVSLHEAQAFAKFEGGALPTEAQWTASARGAQISSASTCAPADVDFERPGPASLGTQSYASQSHGGQSHGGQAHGNQPSGIQSTGAAARGASTHGVEHLLGGVYEWCTDEFACYEGFVAHPYPEYSAVFSRRGYHSLKGASFASGAPLVRSTYRNWDWPQRRQLFSGLRLCWVN